MSGASTTEAVDTDQRPGRGAHDDHSAPRRRIAPVRRVIALLLVIGAVGQWFFPSDLVRLIANEDEVLLGRYSLDLFTVYFILTLLLSYVAGICAFQRVFDRREAFRFIAVTGSVLIGLVIVDVTARTLRTRRYVVKTQLSGTNWPSDRVDGLVRSRPPNHTYEVEYVDKPQPARSFPNPPPGFPTVNVTLTVDGRGFRNLRTLESADIVAVERDDLPAPATFKQELLERLDTRETVFREFCRAEGIEFIEIGDALQEEMQAGTPVYFTYDQHWTRFGHRVVSRVIADHLRSSPGAEAAPAEASVP